MTAARGGLRRLWFQVHKWIGIALMIVLIPLSLSGSVLVWHDWIDETLHPQRHASFGAATLAASDYVAAARSEIEDDERVASLRFDKGGPAVLAATRLPAPGASREGPHPRKLIWLDPADARVFDVAGGNAGIVRVLHVFHGSLMMPGTGRLIVGWLGVAMLLSSLTGLWLWWPVIGSLKRGLRWRRSNDTNTNLHHQSGFWVAVPLAMLSLTGAWISFPAFFGPLTGAPAPDPGERAARMRALPLESTNLDVDAAVAAALAGGEGGPLTIVWPTDQAAQWRITLADGERTVDDATGAVERAEAPGGSGSGVARTMRRLHDGDGMGAVWQVAIFVAGLIPAILGITGIVMWLRSRGWRAAVARRRRSGTARVVPAE